MSEFVNSEMVSQMGVIAINNFTPYTKSLVNGYGDLLTGELAVGDTLKLRKSANPTIRRTINYDSSKGFFEQKVDLTLDQTAGIDVTFKAKERTLDIDNLGERVVIPYIASLSSGLESDIMAATMNKVSNVVTASALGKRQIIDAKALLDLNGATYDRRKLKMALNPLDQAKFIEDTSVLYNKAAKVNSQYDTGELGDLYGFDTFASNLIPKFVTGSVSRTAGAITVSAITALTSKDAESISVTLAGVVSGDTIKAGEILSFAGTKQVNYQTKNAESNLFTVAVLEDVTSTGTTVIVKVTPMFDNASGDLESWKNVDVLPAAGDVVSFLGAANASYNQSFGYHPMFATVKFAKYEVMGKNLDSKSYMEDGMAITYSEEGVFANLASAGRFDAFYGQAVLRDKFAVRIIEI